MRNVVPHSNVGGGRFSADISGLLADQKFENLVHLKLGLTLQVLEEYDGLAKEISAIQILIAKTIEAG